MIKKILLLMLLTLIVLIYPKFTLAAENFSTAYQVNYTVDETGSTVVTQKITLKNLTDQYYVANFTLSIGSTTLTDVSVFDENGPMEVSTEKSDNKTSIQVKFNKQITGVNKTQDFTLKFRSTDFAEKIGKTWDVNLPKIPASGNIEKYDLVLAVPVSFGDPTSIVPKPSKVTLAVSQMLFVFSKNQLENSGISATFGSNQYLSFRIKYHLENNSILPVTTSIALPPDTDYQDIYLEQINPKPRNVTTDSDGNFLAWYKLNSKTKQQIIISGLAKLYLKNKTGKYLQLTDKGLTQWTKADKYWETDSPVILNTLALVLKDKNPTTIKDKARVIYLYTVNTLKYSKTRVNQKDLERFGAITALNNPDLAVCMEFTDLFITLARAAGIPAREMDGYALTLNKNLRPSSLFNNLLHAWPEYYDPTAGWVMIDPTWENTSGGVDYFNKFDLNHLVLAVKGVSSIDPVISDDVQVGTTEQEFSLSPELEIQTEIPGAIWAGFPNNLKITLLNNGHTSVKPLNMEIGASKLPIIESGFVGVDTIPPFGYLSYDFHLKSASVLDNYQDTITITAKDKKTKQAIIIKPFFFFQPFPYIFLGLLFLMILSYSSIFIIHLRKPNDPKIH